MTGNEIVVKKYFDRAEVTRRQFGTGLGAAAFGLTGVGLLAACGSDAATTAATTTVAERTLDLASIKARLATARAVPEFVAPGPAFDVSSAAGKSIFYLAITFNVEIVQNLYRGVQEAAAAAGCTTEVFDAKANPLLYVQGFEQAINRGFDCVLLESIQTGLVAEPMRRAQAAGIKVIGVNEVAEVGENIPFPDGLTAFDYVGGALLDADWILADSGGRDINLVIFHAGGPRHQSMADAQRQRIEELCIGGCKITEEIVGFADFATRLPSLTQTVVNRDPSVNYMITVIDGMTLNVIPGLEAAGAQDRVKIATYNATPSVMQMMKDEHVIYADPGGPHNWEGWVDVDQALRVLTGNMPAPSLTQESSPPNRLFDRTNIDEIDLYGSEEVWYNTEAAKDGFKQLWGVA
jgi:ribose transport system substrate-binding protein